MTVGVIALVLALTLPEDHISWSGWIYFSMAIVVPAHKWFLRAASETISDLARTLERRLTTQFWTGRGFVGGDTDRRSRR